jgi:hypothetical protein
VSLICQEPNAINVTKQTRYNAHSGVANQTVKLTREDTSVSQCTQFRNTCVGFNFVGTDGLAALKHLTILTLCIFTCEYIYIYIYAELI